MKANDDNGQKPIGAYWEYLYSLTRRKDTAP